MVFFALNISHFCISPISSSNDDQKLFMFSQIQEIMVLSALFIQARLSKTLCACEVLSHCLDNSFVSKDFSKSL